MNVCVWFMHMCVRLSIIVCVLCICSIHTAVVMCYVYAIAECVFAVCVVCCVCCMMYTMYLLCVVCMPLCVLCEVCIFCMCYVTCYVSV